MPTACVVSDYIQYVHSYFPEANAKQDTTTGKWHIWRRQTQEPLELPLAVSAKLDIAWEHAAQRADNKEQESAPALVNLNFTQALNALQSGSILRRTCWTKGIWLCWVSPSKIKVGANTAVSKMLAVNTEINYGAHIDIFTPEGDMAGWSPSVDDLVAEDWEMVR